MSACRMGKLLDRLRQDSPAYRLEAEDDGFVLIRRDGQHDDFNAFARDLIDNAGRDYAVFPTPDTQTGYERLFVIPL